MNKADGEPFVASKVLTKKRKAVSLEASPCSPRTEGAPSSDPALESIQTTSDDELDDIATLLRNASRVLVLTGAGISTACGIPDFRSAGGIYALVQSAGLLDELGDPQSVFDIELFREKPEIFYSVARVLSLPVDVLPSRTHTFISLIEKHNKLLRNYTQNVDGIEDAAGITRVVRCHGTLRTASCMRCRRSVAYELIAPAIAAGRVPTCDVCISTVATGASAVTIRAPRRAAAKKASETLTAMVPTDAITRAVLRPDIVFFREPLPSSYARTLLQDVRAADVVLVMGTSLAVAPVSSFMANLPASTPTVLINKTVVKTVHKFQYSLIGDCDTIVAQLQTRLGWHGTDVGSAMRTDP